MGGQAIALGTLLLAAGKWLSVMQGRRFEELRRDMDHRFSELELRRRDASEAWKDLIGLRNDQLERLTHEMRANVGEHAPIRAEIQAVAEDLKATQLTLARDYCSREVFAEQMGIVGIRLEKIMQRLDEMEPHHGGG